MTDLLSSGSWTPAKAAAPSGYTYQWLNAVSCSSASSCVAVGDAYDPSGYEWGLIDSDSSGTWSAQTAPEPANAGTDAGGSEQALLTGVSCASGGTCAATGYYFTTGRAQQLGLIDTFTTSWMGQAAPLPANAGSGGSGLIAGAVACSAICAVAGHYQDGNDRWQGSFDLDSSGTWSASEAPDAAAPDPDPDFVVSGMSCASPTSCVAVGTATDVGGFPLALIETLNGGSWTVQVAPEPADAGSDASGTQSSRLGAVSCASTSWCVAVGTYESSSGQVQVLVDTYSSGSWSATAVSLPSGGSSPSLVSLSCPAVGSCVGTGSFYDEYLDEDPLIAVLSSGTWSTLDGPEPADSIDSYQVGEGFAALPSVSCPSAGSCVAVGSYYDTSSHRHGLIDTLSGGSWSASVAPEPSGSTDHSGELASVVCVSSSFCVAGGEYQASGGVNYGLLDTFSSSAWTAAAAPEPAGAGSGTTQFGALDSVACTTITSCVAVGTYNDSSSARWGLVDTLSGSTWSASQATEPAGAGTDGSSTQSATLDLVGCPSTSWCVAAGTYEDANGYTDGFVETGTAGSFSVTELPEPAGAGTDAGGDQLVTLEVIGCAGNDICEVGGSYLDSGPVTQGLVEQVATPTTCSAPSACPVMTSIGVQGGTLGVEAPSQLYWDVVLNGYDQWAAASTSSLSGCSTGATGTQCSGGSAPVLEVLDATGAGDGWALSAYLASDALPPASLLDFGGAGPPTGSSVDDPLAAYPFSAAAPGTVCDAGSECTVPAPASSCAHGALGITSCPAWPVGLTAGTGPAAQVDLYSAAAASGLGAVCFAAGAASAAGCAGSIPDAAFNLGLPASARSGSSSSTEIVLTVSAGP